MNQQWLVGLIVFAAACYALWHWLPARARKRLARVHPVLGRGSGCGDCKRCGTCGTTAPFPAGRGDWIDDGAGTRLPRSVPLERRGR